MASPAVLTSVWHLAKKDLVLLLRDRMALFWVIAFPLLIAILFGAMFGGSGRKGDDVNPGSGAIPIALVDAERSPESTEFARRIEASKDVKVVRAADVAAANAVVLSGEVAAYLVLEGDFAGPGMLGGKPPRVRIGYAPSRRAESGMLRGIVLDTAALKVQEALASSGMGGASSSPARIETVEVSARAEADRHARPATNWEITFPSSVLWGLMGCAATFAISLVTERQSGTFFRLATAPLTRAQILAGKGLACFLACACVLTLLLSIGVFGLGVRIQSAGAVLAAAVCTTLCFTGLMMFFATLGRTEQAASGMGWGIMTVFAMIGGGMFPLFLMPPWMQTASHASPVKWGILALEGGIWRGFDAAQMAVPCGVLLAVGAVGFVAGTTILSRRDR
jgi:linearmycin/streptolysin S transport system permease protein